MAKFIFLLLVCSIGIHAAHAQGLRSIAETHKKYIGFAVNPTHLTNEAEMAKVADAEFDCFTPENAMKWVQTESSRGHFTFNDGDLITEHAAKHGQKVRGHALVWHHLPAWVEAGHFNAMELGKIVHNHVSTVAGHYKGKIYAWDVVNEALESNGSYRHSVFFNTLGKHYIADAYKTAHEADPAAKLYYNDYGVEGINTKSTAMLKMMEELRTAGVPIHGAGFQAHFSVGHVPHDLQHNLERFSAAGFDVAITEVDIRIQLPADHAKLEQQAKDYAAVVKACMSVSRCVGVTMWGLTDKYSNIVHSHPGWGSGLIFDEHYKPKPAYAAIKQVLEGK